jgi:hypothetical protein
MAPFYHGYDPNFKLDKDDIEGIRVCKQLVNIKAENMDKSITESTVAH